MVPSLAADPILKSGQPIVTGFSGVVSPTSPPPGTDPLDRTFIDPSGNSLVVEAPTPDDAPHGELIDSTASFAATAKDVGQVFGITLDNAPEMTGAAAPDIYVAATSAYGLNLVVAGPDGNPVRSKVGAPGATFMPGQWGSAGGATGSPGSIWKIDGVTGEVSLFTTIAANTGAGLGDIVFDAASQQFFVSDLDTGLIYRLASDGTIIDSFDHGVTGRPTHGLTAVADDGSAVDVTDPAFNTEDPTTWGFTPPERKVDGLAVHGGRLYYAVADGPAVWSVKINPDGSFGDARWELDVTGLPSTDEITHIVFDNSGRMILAQRGAQVGSYDYSSFVTPAPPRSSATRTNSPTIRRPRAPGSKPPTATPLASSPTAITPRVESRSAMPTTPRATALTAPAARRSGPAGTRSATIRRRRHRSGRRRRSRGFRVWTPARFGRPTIRPTRRSSPISTAIPTRPRPRSSAMSAASPSGRTAPASPRLPRCSCRRHITPRRPISISASSSGRVRTPASTAAPIGGAASPSASRTLERHPIGGRSRSTTRCRRTIRGRHCISGRNRHGPARRPAPARRSAPPGRTCCSPAMASTCTRSCSCPRRWSTIATCPMPPPSTGAGGVTTTIRPTISRSPTPSSRPARVPRRPRPAQRTFRSPRRRCCRSASTAARTGSAPSA